jgi:hypothetical protein
MNKVTIKTNNFDTIVEACEWCKYNNFTFSIDNTWPNVYYTFTFKNPSIANIFALKWS